MKSTLSLRSFLLCSAFLAAPLGYGSTIYWDGAPASWNNASNWSTASGAATPDPLVVPGANDGVVFNITPSNAITTVVTLDANQAANSLTFNNTSPTTLTGGGADRVLTLGAAGISVGSGSGSVTFGTGFANNNVTLSLVSGAQAWTHSSSVPFNVNNTVASFNRSLGATLTFIKVSSGDFEISAASLANDATGIVGNWAFNGTGNAMGYARNNITNVGNDNTSTSADFTGWNSATVNYTTSSVISAGVGNTSRTFNTLRYTGTGATYDFSTASSNATFTMNGILAVGASGTLTFQRTGAGSTSSLAIGSSNELIIAGQQAVTISAPITGGSSSALTYSGTSTLTLSSGSSTYGGGTTMNSGSLALTGTNVLGSTSGQLTMNGGTLSTTANQTVGNLTGTGGTIQAASGSPNLTIGQGNSGGGNYQGVIANGAGTMSLTKTGSATSTLSGTNTYSGATAVNGGILALAAAGSIDNTSSVALGGGTFDISAKGGGGYSVNNLTGNGSVIGALTVSTALGIGTSPSTVGTINFGSLSLGTGSLSLGALSTSTFKLTGGGTTADLGNVFTNLTINTGAILDLVQNGAYTLFNKFTLFSYNGALSGTFKDTLSNVLANNSTFTDAGGQWKINYFDTSPGLNGGTGTSFVTVTAVPEPSAALLSGLSLLALLRRRRN